MRQCRQTVAVGLMLGFSAAGFPASAADVWFADPVTGCEVWGGDEAAKPDEIASWSGGCFRGKADGHGVISAFSGGRLVARYVGEMRDGRPHGKGRLSYRFDRGYLVIDGAFVEGFPRGRAEVHWPDGGQFIGNLDGSLENGSGVYFGSDGGRIAASWTDGVIAGRALFESAEGEVFRGTFYSGEPKSGVLIYPDGARYEGAFAGGVPSGKGVLVLTGGGTYQGGFRDGEPHGDGRFTAADGTVSAGRFVDGAPDGEITVTGATGQTTVETWKDGEKMQ